MTAKNTMKWMRENTFKGKKIMDWWLGPKLSLNAGTRYEDSLPENSPEFMPLDNSLFNDLELSLDWHCAVTAYLKHDSPKKFTKATPKAISSAVARIWNHMLPGEEGVPRSSRIVEDCNKALKAFEKVLDKEGGLVKGLANNPGHRHKKARTGQHGGKRIKGQGEALTKLRWLHPDAYSAFEARNNTNRNKYNR